jgi:hypothetical protein
MGGGGQVCEKENGDRIYAGRLTQRGSRMEDGIYYYDSKAQGIIFSYRADKDKEDMQFFFARLTSQDQDDLLIFYKEGGVITYDVYWNEGGRFERGGTMSIEDNCNSRGVYFINIDSKYYSLGYLL